MRRLLHTGCFDMVEESCYPYLNHLEQGFPAFITDTPEYGWVVTACAPIYNSNGEIVCFSAVDLSMNDVLEKENHFLFVLTAILLILIVVTCVLSVLYVKYKIVKPVNMLSEAADQYGQKQDGTVHHEFSTINIHTGDEIEILLRSMRKMEKDIDSYIETLTQTKTQLSSARQQADDMHELAHMDALTGIRNKLAYDKELLRIDSEIQDGSCSFGIAMIDLNFLKIINDTYAHECGISAIISLSKLICDVFVHSPVFRIGGDEFAVILKNNDYHKIELLEREFNQQLEQFQSDTALQPWEKISAAFGYALFDEETDHCADDVFNRADQNMYERKKAMKATRK
ncbi:MAG: diguanylate cyclase [Oscillospiraceae bacterium]